MADLGTDVHCDGDLLPHMPTVSGRLGLAQAIARRLETPRGRMPWWPEYGTDLRDLVNSGLTDSAIASAAEAECLKDERVEDVDVVVERDAGAMTLTVAITDADGPFDAVLTISQAAATLLELDE